MVNLGQMARGSGFQEKRGSTGDEGTALGGECLQLLAEVTAKGALTVGGVATRR